MLGSFPGARIANCSFRSRSASRSQASSAVAPSGGADLAMIQAAGLGVAYRAKPIVAAQAHAKVDHADLTALLYFQGYAAAEFVTD